MKILSVNAGSSSLKFTMFEMPEEKVLVNGTFEKIGLDDGFYTIKLNGEKIVKEMGKVVIRFLLSKCKTSPTTTTPRTSECLVVTNSRHVISLSA